MKLTLEEAKMIEEDVGGVWLLAGLHRGKAFVALLKKDVGSARAHISRARELLEEAYETEKRAQQSLESEIGHATVLEPKGGDGG